MGVAGRQRLRDAAHLVVAGATSLVLINSVYGWERTFVPLGQFEFSSRLLSGREPSGEAESGNRFAGTLAASIPVPVPANYLHGIDMQQVDFDRRQWSYLRGTWQMRGWWYYYLYCLLVKEPVGYLADLGLATWLRARALRALPRRAGDTLVLGYAGAVLLATCLQTGFGSHVRYILPALGFLYVWSSQWAGRACLAPARRLATPLMAVTVFGVASSLSVFPHSLACFHELVGGPRQGHRHLLDSSLDWGQDLLYLKRWLDRHPQARPIALEYYGAVQPRAAGVQWRPSPLISRSAWWEVGGVRPRSGETSRPPEADSSRVGWCAVSVILVHGMPRKVVESGGPEFGKEPALELFAQCQPVSSAGYSIWIYHFDEQEAARAR